MSRLSNVTSSGFSKLFGWVYAQLIQCLHDPDADEETALKYRTRQFNAVMQILPLSSIGNQSISILMAVVFWNQTEHIYMALWVSALWVIGLANIYWWWLCQSSYKNRMVSWWTIWALTIDLGIAALLYVVMSMHLFGVVDEASRLFIAAVLAAFLATGTWLFASLPVAGMVWALVIAAGVVIGLTNFYAGEYIMIATMMCFYWFILTATVLFTSRNFLNGLKAETEIEKQHQVVDLLLHDFEENATDWLWETNQDGTLKHVPTLLSDILNKPIETLKSYRLIDIVRSLQKNPSTYEEALIDNLADKFDGLLPFTLPLVPVLVEGKKQWWSLTAKPLFDIRGNLEGWRGVGSDVTADHDREQDMWQLANFDGLTGLANRNNFHTNLETYFADSAALKSCTLLMIDLDNFKTVNDSLGHTIGDTFLQEVAKRLLNCVDENMLVSRLGGDEFAVLCPEHLDEDEVLELGVRIKSELSCPWSVEGFKIEISTSLGVAYGPENGTTANELIKASDLALYAAKASGRNALTLFNPSMEEEARSKFSLLSDMKDGVERGEFVVFYQPQVRLDTGEISGFEALVRWQHPKRGLVAPDLFIPLAEESGLIVSLGKWVLEKACRDAAHWPSHMRLSVNVSAVQFMDDSIINIVDEALLSSGLYRHQLELELTETTLMEEGNSVLEILRKLRSSGIKIALDDFGTGYSSLSYLQQLPIDKLKIDKAFVTPLGLGSPADSAFCVVDTIVRLANAFQLETTAEGIETELEHGILSKTNCTYGQGYLFSGPVDAANTLDFIANYAPDKDKSHSISTVDSMVAELRSING